jgi:predicted transcriptional regulator
MRLVDEKNKVALPTRAELRILQVLWDLGQATVDEVIHHPGLSPQPNYKTTQTILRIMEEKGLATHASRGRVFVFSPTVTRDEISKLSVRTLLDQNFAGSVTELMVGVLEVSEVKNGELEELEDLIRNFRLQKTNS